jgi:hypothetical protein
MINGPDDHNLEYIDTVLKSYRDFTFDFDQDAEFPIEELRDICKIILKVDFFFSF